LAAAELDARLSDVSKAGIKFENEEDKQYLANIAKMGEGGQYEVKINDTETVKLSELTQQEFNKLIKEQKEGPKTIEDIAKGQMTISQGIANNVKSIAAAIAGGAATSPTLLQGLAGFDRIAKTVTGELAKTVKPSESRKVTETVIQDFEGLFKDIKSGKAINLSLADFADKINSQSKNFEGDIKKGLVDALERVSDKLGKNTYGEALLKDLTSKLTESVGGKVSPTTSNVNKVESVSPIYNQLAGNDRMMSESSTKNVTTTQTKANVDVGGKILVEFSTPNGSQLTQKMLDDWANSPQTKQYFLNLTTPNTPTKAPLERTMGNK
jgi:hypothetical protein